MLRFKTIKSTFENKEGKKLYYPRLMQRGEPVETHELAEALARESSLTVGDVQNVIWNLTPVMKSFLMDGRSVKFNGLGTFSVSAKSRYGVETAKEVTSKQIRSLHIRFLPEGKRTVMDGLTRTMFTGVRFEHYDPETGSTKPDNTGDNGGSGNPDDEFIDPTA